MSRVRRRRRLALAAAILFLAATGAPAQAQPPPPPAPPGFFGVDGWNTDRSDFSQMAGADVGAYRTVFPFELVRTTPGQPYDWSYFDKLVSSTASNGIDLVPMLYGVPPWVSEGLSTTPVHDPVAREQWRLWLIALVDRYGPGGTYWELHPYEQSRPILAWQIWNEPNARTWWGPRPKPGEYATLLRRSSRTIHAEDPEATVLTAGIVARPTNRDSIKGPEFTRRLFASRGTAEAIDGVAYHPYAATVGAVRRQLVGIHEVLGDSGVKAPLWVTEVGWGTEGPADHPLIKSRHGQQQALTDTFEMLLRLRERLRIERALWYLWQDRPDSLCLWCQSSGLLSDDAAPKGLLQTFRDSANR